MRWLSFSSAPLERSLGGTEVYAERLAGALRQRGAEVFLASYAAPTERAAPLQLPALPAPLTRWQRWNCVPFREREFAALVGDVHPEVVHFHGSLQVNPPEFMSVARAAGAKVLWTHHAPGNTCLQTALLEGGRAPCDGYVEAGRCARCTLISAGLPTAVAKAFGQIDMRLAAPWVPSRLRHPFEVRAGTIRFQSRLREALQLVDLHLTHANWSRELLVRNGVAPERLRNLALPPPANNVETIRPSSAMGRDDLSVGIWPFQLLFAGRYIDIKGLHVLAEALRGPLRDDHDLSLTVLGAPGVAAYEARVRALLADDPRVTIRGAAPPDETLAAMESAEAVVVPSTWLETGPYTVLEAQWTGAAVIGTGLGGIAERLREDPHGYPFARGDATGLAVAIRAARERRLDGPSRQARREAQRRLHTARFDAELGALLTELSR